MNRSLVILLGAVALAAAVFAGSYFVSQRACVFCGSRVVLYPIADALHIVHGPIGCAAYTWDIRGALSSGPQLHRNSFSTDLQEMDVIYGGEKKLQEGLLQLIDRFQPKAAFVYGTCIVGIIGDDIEAVCRTVEKAKGILMREHGLCEEDAFRKIQRQSMDTRRSMREIAEAIILIDSMKKK